MENVEACVEFCVQEFIVSVVCGLVVANLVISHGVDELIPFVPRVQFFISMIVADRSRFPEWIREAQRHIQQFHRVEVKSESNFGVSFGRRVDCVQHTANDEHLAHLAKEKSIWLRAFFSNFSRAPCDD